MGEDKNKSIIIKLACVLAAFFLWIYTSNESNSLQTRVVKNIPVQILNTEALEDAGLIVSIDEEYTISLKITGTAASIYSATVDDFTVVADLSGYVLSEGTKKIPVNILKSPESVNIVNDTTLWAEIKFDKLVKKEMQVKINTTGNVEDGYYQDSLVVEPSTVTISGSEKYVDMVSSIYAEIDLENTKTDLTLSLPVLAVDSVGKTVSGITINPENVKVSIPIKGTKNVDINITTKGSLQENMILEKITPSIAQIKIAGDEKLISSIESISTEPVDLSLLTEKSNKLTVKLDIPEDLVLVGDDEAIEVIIDLDKVIEKNLTVDIENRNLDSALDVKYVSKEVSLIVKGAENILNNLSELNVVGFLDFMDLNEGSYDIPVKFELPNNVIIVSQNLKNVNVAISKKNITDTTIDSSEDEKPKEIN
ncbi:CdaR family protein [Clostridium grantii]|uniref:YbbR domain-containing protein n=1 Tax=Clostridium grantii DSM 8605 TaxID=1121316 RepID=A0A1M5TSD2_9CLOT|nr:CdaR family protein [Clostridium grantii]SHH53725.1 YbbR domain-containing protein [Clostridium grantii DSM 8605]